MLYEPSRMTAEELLASLPCDNYPASTTGVLRQIPPTSDLAYVLAEALAYGDTSLLLDGDIGPSLHACLTMLQLLLAVTPFCPFYTTWEPWPSPRRTPQPANRSLPSYILFLAFLFLFSFLSFFVVVLFELLIEMSCIPIADPTIQRDLNYHQLPNTVKGVVSMTEKVARHDYMPQSTKDNRSDLYSGANYVSLSSPSCSPSFSFLPLFPS